MVRAVVLIVAALATVAHAQTPASEGARLFEQGRALAKAGKYAEACDAFGKSLELDHAIGTQLNYADCHEKLGRRAEAWRLFDAAADAEKVTNPDRARYARGRADQLVPTVGVVVLRIAAPSAPKLVVSIAGRAVTPAAEIREIVDPGTVTIVARAAAGQPFERTEKVAAGRSVTVDIPAFADTTRVVDVPPSTDPEVDTARRRSRVLLAYGVGGAGALALVGGIVVGLRAKSDYEDQFANGQCTDTSPPVCMAAGIDAQQRARSLATVGTVLGVGGLALVAGGAVLFLTAPRDVVIRPTATAQSAGVVIVGNF